MAYIVLAYVVMAYVDVAYIVIACIAMAYVVMAYIVMAYVVMAYIVMAAVGHCLASADRACDEFSGQLDETVLGTAVDTALPDIGLDEKQR